MPKNNIDYSNTVIYKIFCKNHNITDMYIGHTTNFIKRKHQHRSVCIKNNSNTKVYKIINENGGWDNWNMVEIASYNCKDSVEACTKEQQHIEILKPSLNTNSALSFMATFPKSLQKSAHEYICKDCNFQCSKISDFNRHKLTLNINKILNVN